jgi:hypothetical protein
MVAECRGLFITLHPAISAIKMSKDIKPVKQNLYEECCFVDCASLYDLVNKSNLVHNSAFEKRNKYIKQNCAPS